MTARELWIEFGQVALAHLIAVASPGPDFAVVVRQSLEYGRKTAIWTSLGIGTGISLHVAYSLLGIGLLNHAAQGWFDFVRYAGAGYLAWLGIQAWRSATPREKAGFAPERRVPPLVRRAFLTGFLTNALNPKATLFFVVLFLTVVSPETPTGVQLAFGAWIIVATAAWFCAVSFLFTHARVIRVFVDHAHWVNRALGLVLLAFAGALLFSKFSS
jgi:RhtB (resistance to homoserine/threonine) family protein